MSNSYNSTWSYRASWNTLGFWSKRILYLCWLIPSGTISTLQNFWKSPPSQLGSKFSRWLGIMNLRIDVISKGKKTLHNCWHGTLRKYIYVIISNIYHHQSFVSTVLGLACKQYIIIRKIIQYTQMYLSYMRLGPLITHPIPHIMGAPKCHQY